MTSPKILYCANSAFAFATFLRPHLEVLSRRGFQIVVALPHNAPPPAYLAENGIEVHFLAIKREIAPCDDLRCFWQLWNLIRAVRPDIINVTTPKMGLLGSIAAFLARTPIRIYTMRGLRLETKRGFARLVLLCAEWIACRGSSVVICISGSLRKRALELRLVEPAKAILLGPLVSEGVCIADYAPSYTNRAAAELLRTKLLIAPAAPVLGFIGRLTRDKGISELVLAFQTIKKNFPTARLLLIGDFEPGDPVPPAICRAIREDHAILHVGYVDHPHGYYHLMDVLVLPTHREGLGKVLLEAAAAGKPVIASRTVGVVDVVQENVTGILVKPGDHNELAAAMTRVLSDPAAAIEMGAAARERAAAHFDADSHFEDLMNFYRADRVSAIASSPAIS